MSLSSSLSHTITHNNPQQSAVFQQHRATLRYIYISIHSGLALFNSTSLRQSFTGCAIYDRLCTEYEVWIMQNIHKHQGYSWVNSDVKSMSVGRFRTISFKICQSILILHTDSLLFTFLCMFFYINRLAEYWTAAPKPPVSKTFSRCWQLYLTACVSTMTWFM